MQDVDRTRLVLAGIAIVCAAALAVSYATATATADEIRGDASVEQAFITGERGPVVGERDATTVVATDSTAVVSDDGSGPRERAELVAFAPDGRISYYDDEHTRYWDVDPVEGTAATVEYVYADHLDADECGAETVCTRNGVERVNLTTGERTEAYSRVTPGKHSTRWHDADRVDEHRLLVADIDRDRVYLVNATTGLVEWEWDALNDYDPESGGPYPEDWTHVNDVEVVEIDGRPAAMVSLRNHDQVAFVDFERGLREEWTLGTDDDHDVLYEQHNPDYVPPERGGPAVLVADSENSRIVEYQREGGEWTRTWTWEDERVQWARDADRLPNGHTLIADSNGDRVVEVDRDGEVVWTANVGFPYEAERLGTGDESATGESAASLGLESRPAGAEGDRGVVETAIALVPPAVANGVAYLLPGWVGRLEGVAVIGLLVTLPLWLRHEWRRTDLDVRVGWPPRLEGR